MVNLRRSSMFLSSFRRAIHYQNLYPIFSHKSPQIREVAPFFQVFPPRNLSLLTESKVEEDEEAKYTSNTNQEQEWLDRFKENLHAHTAMSEKEVLLAFKDLSKYPEKALSLFTWYKTHNAYKPTSAVYNALLRTMVGIKDYTDHVWNLIKEIKENGLPIEQATLLLFSARSRGSDLTKDVAEMYIWMVQTAKEKPDAVICFEVLQCLSSNAIPDTDAAFRVLEAFKKHGGAMEKIVYDRLHKCLTKAGKFEAAEKVVESMANEGFMPDNITYRHLIYGLCNANRLEEARSVLYEAREKGRGRNLDIDKRTWKIIIEGHYKANEIDKAMALLSEMVGSGCNFDWYVTQGLVSSLCSENREMDAYNLMCKSVEEHKIMPSCSSYLEVIDKLGNSGMFEEAFKMFDLMKRHGYPPFVSSLFVSVAKHGTVDDACRFLHRMRKNEVYHKSCVAMIDAFHNAGKHAEAYSLAFLLAMPVVLKS